MIIYEKAVPVFIDSEEDTWNMSPEALERAFEKYPNVKQKYRFKEMKIKSLNI